MGRVLLAGKGIEHEKGLGAARVGEVIPGRGAEFATIAVAERLGLPIVEAM